MAFISMLCQKQSNYFQLLILFCFVCSSQEFIYCLVWSILYFIASLLIVFKGSVYAAAGVSWLNFTNYSLPNFCLRLTVFWSTSHCSVRNGLFDQIQSIYFWRSRSRRKIKRQSIFKSIISSQPFFLLFYESDMHLIWLYSLPRSLTQLVYGLSQVKKEHLASIVAAPFYAIQLDVPFLIET